MTSFGIKENKKNALVLLGLFLSASWFYWFQYRPSKIKHECSWIKETTAYVPARPTQTEQQLRENGLLKNCQDATRIDAFELLSPGWCNTSNQELIKSYKIVQPEIPIKESWRKAMDNEYRFCLHDKGL